MSELTPYATLFLCLKVVVARMMGKNVPATPSVVPIIEEIASRTQTRQVDAYYEYIVVSHLDNTYLLANGLDNMRQRIFFNDCLVMWRNEYTADWGALLYVRAEFHLTYVKVWFVNSNGGGVEHSVDYSELYGEQNGQ